MIALHARYSVVVVAVSPMSVPGAADPVGEAAVVPDAAAEADAVLPDDDPGDELLAVLQPAASRTAASAAITASRPPLAITVVSSTRSLRLNLYRQAKNSYLQSKEFN
jgi:hypothetical protein